MDTRANHQRVQESLLTPLERPVLAWLARHLPSWTKPDHLTLIGFAAMFLAGLAYWGASQDPAFFHLASLFVLLNWFGDSLDGTLARHRRKLRPRYGFYVDHIIDSFGILFLFGGLALSGYISERTALVFLISYFLFAINTYLATHALGVFEISFWKLGPTELRILLVVGNCVAAVKPNVSLAGGSWLLFDVGAGVGAVVMTIAAVAASIRNTRTLYNLERV